MVEGEGAEGGPVGEAVLRDLGGVVSMVWLADFLFGKATHALGRAVHRVDGRAAGVAEVEDDGEFALRRLYGAGEVSLRLLGASPAHAAAQGA